MLLPYEEIINSNIQANKIFNRGHDLINLPCALDIETTSTYNEQGEKIAFCYVWALGVGLDHVFYGRTFEELVIFLQFLQSHFALDEKRRLIIYVHNLGYEFQFIRKYLTWQEGGVFAVSERKPLKALCSLNIEFRCSYMLSGFSLANLAKNLLNFKIKKLVGDLDYSLERHEKTPLTSQEMAYIENDVLIVLYYIAEQILIYGNIARIPLTNTGRVRKFVKDKCFHTKKNHSKEKRGKMAKYQAIMQDLTLDVETYTLLKRAFMGGFTHANALFSGKVLQDVTSIDFTSSYPAVMVSEFFPMSRFRDVTPTEEEFYKYLDDYAVIFNVKFINISCKIAHETYISESKCFEKKNALINNGRIIEADYISTTITEIDFKIMEQVYKWDSIELNNVKIADKAYLPKPIIESVLEMYQDKTTLKDVEGSEVEYLLKKGMLNSIYGMSVTDVLKDDIIYLDEWGIEKIDLEKKIEEENNKKTRFLYYAWGVYVTAYARKNLWSGILAIGQDYIYSDTDSLKIINYENHKSYIEWYDKQIMNKMLAMCEHYNLNPDLLTPKTKEGKIKPLGVWDYEGTYNNFKTLGAKRYLTEKGGKFALTCAGLSKVNGLNYMIQLAEGKTETVFNLFTDNLHIPADETGKSTHTYIDDEQVYLSVDYLGNMCEITSKSSIHLEKCDFTLNLSDEYINFLEMLANGYIYKGLDYELL